MSWLSPKLRHRIQIQKGVDTPNTWGGFDRSYETLTTIWAGLKVEKMSQFSQTMFEAIRGETVTDTVTHDFIIRFSAVSPLMGTEFSNAFTTGFNNIEDLVSVKSDYFVFLEEGSSVKGRRYRIRGIWLDEERKEYLRISCIQLKEEGTGWPD